LETNARQLDKRIVLLFDDAAHIGRERPLIEFFDIFRTISTSRISCKASIYPGVTKFGVRFDVFNDATVIDIARDERKDNFQEIFVEITNKRFPDLATKIRNSRSVSIEEYGRIMGRAVTGNLRSFVYACNSMQEFAAVTYPELTKCLLDLSSNYFWPLLEEVAPKLGTYEVLVEPAQEMKRGARARVTHTRSRAAEVDPSAPTTGSCRLRHETERKRRRESAARTRDRGSARIGFAVRATPRPHPVPVPDLRGSLARHAAAKASLARLSRAGRSRPLRRADRLALVERRKAMRFSFGRFASGEAGSDNNHVAPGGAPSPLVYEGP